MSLEDSENLEKSLYARDKANDKEMFCSVASLPRKLFPEKHQDDSSSLQVGWFSRTMTLNIKVNLAQNDLNEMKIYIKKIHFLVWPSPDLT